MKNATLQIVGYGENAAIVVPRPLLEVFGFELGDQIRIPFDRCERVPPPKKESVEDLSYDGTLGGRP
ncbi:MAG TPA: hypothetical protein VEY12_11070, partial [Thermoplasmata archaeon]|nr:hypothetical protein [Thermoplasmata archaeon]